MAAPLKTRKSATGMGWLIWDALTFNTQMTCLICHKKCRRPATKLSFATLINKGFLKSDILIYRKTYRKKLNIASFTPRKF
jgi:hypothetical protein